MSLHFRGHHERRDSPVMSRRGEGPAANVAKVVTLESTQRQVAVYNPSDPNEGKTGDPVKDLEAKLNYITEAVPINPQNIQGSTAGAGSGEFHLYRAGRRREQMRIAAMEREDNANVAKAEFEARQEARTREAEEKTAKNRNKRKAKKLRAKAAKDAKKGTGGDGAGSGPGTGPGEDDDEKADDQFEELD